MATFTVTTNLDTGDDSTVAGDLAAETADGGGLSLREAIILANAATDADMITFANGAGQAFENGGTITLSGAELVVSADVTIDGDLDNDGAADVTITGDVNGDDTTKLDALGHTVTDADNNTALADNASRIVNIAGGVVTIDGVVVTGGVQDSNAGPGGGGILVQAGATVTVVNSSVSGNLTAGDERGGGGIANLGDLTVTDSLLSGNRVEFIPEASGRSGGGGIFNGGGSLTLDGVSFLGNTAEHGSSAPANGGGVFVNTGEVTITGSTFIGNSAIGGAGGAISVFLSSASSIAGSTFSGNDADAGGAIFVFGGAPVHQLTDNIVTGNTAPSGGGGVLANSTSINISGGTISGNVTGGQGGGINTRGGTIDGVLIENNSAGSGGGVSNTSPFTPLAISNSTIRDNTASSTGGGIDAALLSELSNSTVSGNHAGQLSGAGGGIYAFVDGVITNSIFTDNSTTGLGGGLYIWGGDASIENSTVSGNTADAGGGFVDSAGVTTTIANSTFDGNEATNGRGGGLLANGAIDITASSITNNSASGDGGGFSTQSSTTAVNIRDSTISNNSAFSGGGLNLALSSGVVATLANNTVASNYSAGDGGGISVVLTSLGAGSFSDNGSIYADNTAVGAGGGISSNLAATITGAIFERNDAGGAGGGLHFAGNTAGTALSLSDVTASDNVSALTGGGISLASGVVSASTLAADGNASAGDGGGLAVTGATVTVERLTAAANTSQGEGGGIAVTAGLLNASNATIANNSALDGGGVRVSAGTLSLEHATITGNSASTGTGGASASASATLVNSIVVGNGAGTQATGVTAVNSLTSGNAASIFASLDPLTGGGLLADNGGSLLTALLRPDLANPAIDATTAPAGLTTDATGAARTTDFPGVDNAGLADLGALELAPGTEFAVDDVFATSETVMVTGNLFDDNGGGVDFAPVAVAEVEGNAAAVGIATLLASGALVTVQANGDFSYDPNGAFEHLPAAGSGATPTTATDSFTYTLAGGSAATVTVTISGVDNDDVLVGTALADVLLGGAGADSIEGLGDSDVLLGGDGDDTVSGGAGNDILIGGNDNDTLLGGVGVDTTVGGAGNDVHHVDNAADTIVEVAGEGVLDTVRASVSFTLAGSNDIEVLTSDDQLSTNGLNLTGNELAQTIVGNAGDNTLGDGGGAGADLLRGLGGNDNYVVYNSGTQIIEASTQVAADRIYAGRDYVLADGVFVELLTTTSQFATYSRDIEGNTYGQTIVGNDGQNTLGDGGGSAANGDTLVGGGGNDLYIVRNAGSIVLEAAGEGIDRVSTSVNFTLSAGSHVESINTTSRSATSALQLTGNELGQTLQGNAGANVLYGMAGADTLLGEDGADTLVGGAGIDELSGMGGGDVFAFMASDSTVGFEDTITDFSGAGGDIDQIDLSAFASSFIGAGPFTNTAGEVIFFDNGVNTYVQADSDGVNGADFSVILTGLHVLTASDFLLGP